MPDSKKRPRKSGRPPIGRKAMTAAERQRRSRAKRNFNLKTARKEIARLTRLIIESDRIKWMEPDLRLAVAAAELAYGWHPADRDAKQLKTQLAKLHQMAARFRSKPMTYHRGALCRSDPRAFLSVHERAMEWERHCRRSATKEPMPSCWIPPEWVAIAQEEDALAGVASR
jgi:hypothetical protein